MNLLLGLLGQVVTEVIVLAVFLFPMWVALHAWRKGYRALSIAVWATLFFPFLGFLVSIPAFLTLASSAIVAGLLALLLPGRSGPVSETTGRA